jgi:hypothetical protein
MDERTVLKWILAKEDLILAHGLGSCVRIETGGKLL